MTHTVTQARISTPTAGVCLEQYRWSGPTEITYEIPEFALFRTLDALPSRSRVTPSSGRDWTAEFEGLGFWPAGVPLRFETSRPSLRVAICSFPAGRLEALTDYGASWSLDEWKNCFGLRNPRLNRAMLQLAQEALSPGFGSPLLVEGMGMTIAIELARHLRREGRSPSLWKGGLAPRELARVVDMIRDVEGGCPSVAELGRACGVSERHLMRAFKATTGMTVGEYATQVRTTRAQELLRSDLPIKAIAARLGYSTPSHFAAAFRKATGLSPIEFRRSLND